MARPDWPAKIQLGPGQLFMRRPLDGQWTHIGTTDPTHVEVAADETIGSLIAGLPVQVTVPWPDPEHDVMADIREAMQLADRMPPHRELHCASDVAEALVKLGRPEGGPPWTTGMDLLLGIDVIAEGDMPPGQWEMRDRDGTIIDGGKLLLL